MANDSKLGPRNGKNQQQGSGGIRRIFIIIPAVLVVAAVAVYLYLNWDGGSAKTNATQTPSQAVVPSIAPAPTISEIPIDTPAVNTGGENWQIILVNNSNKLPEGYSVELSNIKNEQAVDGRCLPDLQAMMDACREAGHKPLIVTSFRSEEKQKSLYDEKVKKLVDSGKTQEEAEAEAVKSVAAPGTGDHQTGLAIDIVDEDKPELDYEIEKTDMNKWLRANCATYGFILRYPVDKQDVTGLPYEPWHFRYVGKDAAKVIMDKKITLEEYLQLPEEERKPSQPETTGSETETPTSDAPAETPSDWPGPSASGGEG